MKESARSVSVKPLIGPALIFALAVYFYHLAGKIQEVPIPGQLGPAFWPKVIFVLLMISCGIKTLEIITAQRRQHTGMEAAAPAQATDYVKLAAMIVSIVGVVYAIEILGFLIANFLFLIIFMRIAGWHKKISLLVISTLGTLSLLFLFVKVVYLPLPKGQWFFYDLTIYLYRLLHII